MEICKYDPAHEWDKHCEQQERELAKRPICPCCGERITDEYCYDVEGGRYICENCMETVFRVETPVSRW